MERLQQNSRRTPGIYTSLVLAYFNIFIDDYKNPSNADHFMIVLLR